MLMQSCFKYGAMPTPIELPIDKHHLLLENGLLNSFTTRHHHLVRQELAFTNFLLREAKSLRSMLIYKKRIAGELLPPEGRSSSTSQVVFGDSSKCSLEMMHTSAANYKLADSFMLMVDTASELLYGRGGSRAQQLNVHTKTSVNEHLSFLSERVREAFLELLPFPHWHGSAYKHYLTLQAETAETIGGLERTGVSSVADILSQVASSEV
ncbi:hypothetical protein EJB05_15540, partial [Eragrostis curvula]